MSRFGCRLNSASYMNSILSVLLRLHRVSEVFRGTSCWPLLEVLGMSVTSAQLVSERAGDRAGMVSLAPRGHAAVTRHRRGGHCWLFAEILA
jgi:hypothetical protein